MAVDLRGLPPPEPMLQIMQAIESEPPAAGYWAFLLPHFPHPLLRELATHGLAYRVEPASEGKGVLLRIMPGEFAD